MFTFQRTKNVLDVVSTIAVVAASSLLIWTLVADRPGNPGEPPAVDVSGLRVDVSRVANARGDGHVAILEFSDYECPFCSTYARTTFPQVARELIDTGLVRYVTFAFPLESIHPQALRASEAAECAGRQGFFWEMHERLFVSSPALSQANLLEQAHNLNLDQAQFETCLQGDSLDKIRADQAEGQRLGVRGTPAFFIGVVEEDGAVALVSRIDGAMPFDVLKQEVEAAGVFRE